MKKSTLLALGLLFLAARRGGSSSIISSPTTPKLVSSTIPTPELSSSQGIPVTPYTVSNPLTYVPPFTTQAAYETVIAEAGKTKVLQAYEDAQNAIASATALGSILASSTTEPYRFVGDAEMLSLGLQYTASGWQDMQGTPYGTDRWGAYLLAKKRLGKF